MAKKIITTLTDDLDGTDADETLSFAVDGISYEIDLNHKNAARLRQFLAEFQDSGRRIGRVGAPAQLSSHRRTGSAHSAFLANKDLNRSIREWAAANGYQLNERGRIPQHIVDAYHSGASRATKLQEELTSEPPASPAPAPARRGRRATPVFTPEKRAKSSV